MSKIQRRLEQNYRRGYRDGMIEAYNEHIGNHWTNKEMDRLFNWIMYGDLFQWFRDAESLVADGSVALPPTFRKEKG